MWLILKAVEELESSHTGKILFILITSFSHHLFPVNLDHKSELH